jgi:hypothetical protein
MRRCGIIGFFVYEGNGLCGGISSHFNDIGFWSE